LAEEEKDGALAPAEPVHTPLSEIVDKPRISEPPARAIVDEPRPEPRQRKPEKPAIPEGYVPLREVLDERDRRKQSEDEAKRYRTWIEDQQRKLAIEQDKDPAPDMFRDPNAYNQWVERQVQKRAESIAKQQFAPVFEQVSQQQLRVSEMTAEKHLGPDKWKKLNEWIEKQGDQFKAWATSQPDPYFAAYDQYRQRTTFERLGNDDIDTLIEKEVAKRLAAQRGPIDPPDGDIEEDDADFDAPKPKPAAPKSFASSRSADPTRDPGGRFTGPKPLGAILAEKSPNRRKR
jgi:hypothetical protein